MMDRNGKRRGHKMDVNRSGRERHVVDLGDEINEDGVVRLVVAGATTNP